MTIPAHLVSHEATVLPQWIDFNGHMNVAYYVLAFDHASDAFFERIGALHDYRERHGQSFFTLEMHVTYERELTVDTPIRFTTQIIGFDAKRLHLFHAMFHGTEGYLAATNDIMLVNIDFATRRSAPIHSMVREGLDRLWTTHKELPVPPQSGRRVGLSSGRPTASP